MEDDVSVAQVLKENLESQHYLVDLATDGQAGWELAEAFEYGLILLDLMLPKLDGISFCRQLRTQGNRTPILLLTATDSCTKKVMGLDAGADDYVVKPPNLHELSARIRALLRRGSSTLLPVLKWGDLHLDPSNCSVTYGGQLLQLTSKEYALLELFLRNTHRIFSQNALLDHLWSFEEPPSENTVRAHIKLLRQKLKRAGAPDLIETLYGLGYRLKSSPHFAITTAQPQQQVLPELTAVWEKFKDKYSAHIKVLERAIVALLEGTLTEGLRQQALREAHTLVGSLGSLGFEEACRLCREIERLLQAEASLSRAHLSELVMALRQELRQPSKLVKP